MEDRAEDAAGSGEVLREGTAAPADGAQEGGFDWTKFEVGSPQEETAAMEESVTDTLKADEAEAGYVKAAAAKVGEEAQKPAPGKPARRFRPVERLTLEEILEHAKRAARLRRLRRAGILSREWTLSITVICSDWKNELRRKQI